MRSRDTMNSAQQGPCSALGIGPNHLSNVSLHTCKPAFARMTLLLPASGSSRVSG